MSSTQKLPRVVLPGALEQTCKMPRVELENLLRATSVASAAESPPPSSVVLPLVTRK